MSAARPSGRDPGAPRTATRTAPRRSRTAPRSERPHTSGASHATATPAATSTALLDPPESPAAAPDTGVGRPGPAAASRRGRTQTSRTGSRLRAPRHRLLLVCTGVLAVGLFGVLLLNTIISQGAFRQHELEVALILTAEKEEALARQVQQAEAPIEVEKRARALGMVPAGAPVFLRLSDGRILGEPVPAPAPTGPVDFADAPGLQPVPPTANATASPGAIDPALDPATGLSDTASAAPAPAASAPATDPAASAAPSPQPSGSPVGAAPGDAASGAPNAVPNATPDATQGARP